MTTATSQLDQRLFTLPATQSHLARGSVVEVKWLTLMWCMLLYWSTCVSTPRAPWGHHRELVRGASHDWLSLGSHVDSSWGGATVPCQGKSTWELRQRDRKGLTCSPSFWTGTLSTAESKVKWEKNRERGRICFYSLYLILDQMSEVALLLLTPQLWRFGVKLNVEAMFLTLLLKFSGFYLIFQIILKLNICVVYGLQSKLPKNWTFSSSVSHNSYQKQQKTQKIHNAFFL